MNAATIWVTDSKGDRVPTTICAACGKQISEYSALYQRGAAGQADVRICDTTECWMQWNRR